MRLLKCGIWAIFVIGIYVVFAVEFKPLRLMSLPLNEIYVEKLNDIAKNFSLSYIAGVVFYIFSELIPFTHKRRCVRTKSIVLVARLRSSIVTFLEEFCGSKDMSDINQLYFDAFQKEYSKNEACKLSPDKILAVKKLRSAMDDVINVLLQQGEYLEENDHNAILNIKIEPFYDFLLGLSQTTSTNVISSKIAMTLIHGLVNSYNDLGKLNIIRENNG